MGLVLCVRIQSKRRVIQEFTEFNVNKKALLTQNNQSDAIEPRSQVGECPEQQTELDGVNEIFNQEQASQFSQESVDVGNADGGYLLDLLLGQS